MSKRDILFAKAVSGGGSSPAPTLIEKSVNQNGTYNASDDEADGYSKVTVNVENVPQFLPRTYPGATDFTISSRLIFPENYVLPDNMGNLGVSCFENNLSIKNIIIGSGYNYVPSKCFKGCINLKSVEIGVPNEIGPNAFANCTSLESIKFTNLTPPTVTNSNAWQNLPTTCKIYVPQGSLTAYTSANYYPDPNTYQYIEY